MPKTEQTRRRNSLEGSLDVDGTVGDDGGSSGGASAVQLVGSPLEKKREGVY
jgi:hypothetical protein